MNEWFRSALVAIGYVVMALGTFYALTQYASYSLGYDIFFAILLALPVPIILTTYFLKIFKRDVKLKTMVTCYVTYLIIFAVLNLLPYVAPQVTNLLSPYDRLLRNMRMLVASWTFVTVLMVSMRYVSGREI